VTACGFAKRYALDLKNRLAGGNVIRVARGLRDGAWLSSVQPDKRLCSFENLAEGLLRTIHADRNAIAGACRFSILECRPLKKVAPGKASYTYPETRLIVDKTLRAPSAVRRD